MDEPDFSEPDEPPKPPDPRQFNFVRDAIAVLAVLNIAVLAEAIYKRGTAAWTAWLVLVAGCLFIYGIWWLDQYLHADGETQRKRKVSREVWGPMRQRHRASKLQNVLPPQGM